MVLSIEHDHDNIAILSWNWKKRGIDLFLLGGPAHVDGWLRCALMKYILNRYLSQNKIWFNAYMTVVLKKKKMIEALTLNIWMSCVAHLYLLTHIWQ